MRAVNTATKNDTSIVLPTIETIERSFHSCIISTFDISNMFYNVAVHEDSMKFFNFYVENSVWSHGRLPQGWCGSPKIASEAMQETFHPTVMSDFKKANNITDADFPYHNYESLLDQFVDHLDIRVEKSGEAFRKRIFSAQVFLDKSNF